MWMEDLRNAFRTLRSAPGFALTAILSLSVGIGGTVSMFTVVNSVLLKPLALPDSDKLVRVTNRYTAEYASSRKDNDAPGLLAREFIRWRKHARLLASLLFQVGTSDPATFVVTPLVLILTAALPCWLLARKASRFDPMDALRLE